jgi:hypothetical protein
MSTHLVLVGPVLVGVFCVSLVPARKDSPVPALAGILEEIRILPPVREPRAGEDKLFRTDNVPSFSNVLLDQYKMDGYKSVTELRDRYKKNAKTFPNKYPIRAAFFAAAEALEESAKTKLPETMPGPLNAKQKNALLNQQQHLGMVIFTLEQELARMKTAAEDRSKETSKRWRANFDFALARLEARLLYLMECDYLLASARAERMPQLKQGQTGWRVISMPKPQITEVKAKQLIKEVAKRWERIGVEYPQTPWAVLAERESQIPLGLDWKARNK